MIEAPNMITLRCSALPSLAKCSAPVMLSLRGEPMIEWGHAASALGRAVHKAAAQWITTRTLPPIPDLADEHGLDDHDELLGLIEWTVATWNKYADHFPDPACEVSLEWYDDRVRLTGQIDVLSIGPKTAVFADHKTGRVERDYHHQKMGYVFLLFANHAELETVGSLFLSPQLGIAQYYEYSREDARRWFEEVVVGQIVRYQGRYCAGEQCIYCPAFATCEARMAFALDARRVVASSIAADDSGGAIRALLPNDLSNLWVGMQIIEKSIERCRDTIKQEVMVNGPLDLGDGRELRITESARVSIDTKLAWPIVAEALTDDEFASVVKIGVGSLKDAVRNKASRGNKARDVESMMARLEHAGALSSLATESLRATKKAEEQHGEQVD